MKDIATWILRCLGWTIAPAPTEHPPRSIICVAPHTSNMDFLIGKLYYMTTGKPHHFLMKKDWFVFPLGLFFKAMGGIPVDRGKNSDLVGALAQYILQQPEIHIGITPEGTRSAVERWRTGFYRIALQAGIPIELAVIDYSTKQVGVFEIFHPTGDVESDIAYMHSRFSSRQARHPKNFTDYAAQ